MLYGAEANIINRKGNLDLNDDILKGLDYVIASMHYPTIKPGTVEENTEAYINAMKNPYVTVIGHCDDTKFPIDPFKLFSRCDEVSRTTGDQQQLFKSGRIQRGY